MWAAVLGAERDEVLACREMTGSDVCVVDGLAVGTGSCWLRAAQMDGWMDGGYRASVLRSRGGARCQRVRACGGVRVGCTALWPAEARREA